MLLHMHAPLCSNNMFNSELTDSICHNFDECQIDFLSKVSLIKSHENIHVITYRIEISAEKNGIAAINTGYFENKSGDYLKYN